MEPIKTVEQLLTADTKFGFVEDYQIFFDDVPESVDSFILNKKARCPDRSACLNWAAVYQNMSIIFDNLNIEICRGMGNLTEAYNSPLLCELEDGGVTSVEVVFLVPRGHPLL